MATSLDSIFTAENASRIGEVPNTENSGILSNQEDPILGSGLSIDKAFSKEAEHRIQGDPVQAMAFIGRMSMASTASDRFQMPAEFGDSKLDKGIRYAVELDNLNDMRAQLQGLPDKLGNSAVKLVGGTLINGVGGIATSASGLYEYARTGEGSKFWNNAAGHFVDNLSEGLQEQFPHYYMDSERQKGILDQFGTYNFWGDGLVNGLSFMTGAMLTGWMTGGIGTLGSMAGRAAGLNRLFQTAKSLGYARGMTMETAKGIGAVGTLGKIGKAAGETARQAAYMSTGAMYESGLEARMAYDTVKNGLVDELAGDRIKQQEAVLGRPLTEEERLNMLTDEEKKLVDSKATSAANYNFAGNMALVGMGNMISMSRLYGTDRLVRSFGAKGNAIEAALGRTLQSKAGMSIANAARTIGAGKWVLRAGYEGFVEEGGQGLMNQYAENYISNAVYRDPDGDAYIKDYLEDFTQNVGSAFSDMSDTENMKEIVLGLIIGGMGMPTRLGGPGLAWTGSIRDTKATLQSDSDIRDFAKNLDAKVLKRFEEDRKKNPEKYMNQAHNAVLYHLMSNRAKLREAAEKAGDDQKLRDLDSDDLFDKFFAMAELGQLGDAEKTFELEIESMRKADPETFKDMFGFEKDMPQEEMDAKVSELKQDLRDQLKQYREAQKIIDRTYPQLREQRYTDIDRQGSEAWRRRVMIRAAAKSQENDAREKYLWGEFAELTNGQVEVQEDGMVDEIVYKDDKGGIRRARVGTMNVQTSVAGQILESKRRISELTSKKQRTAKEQEDLDNLTALMPRLENVKDKTRTIHSFLLESTNDKEAKSLGEWTSGDPIRDVADKERIKNILDELRHLRATRIEFNTMFLRAADPVEYQKMVKEADTEVKAAAQKISKELKEQANERTTALTEFRMKVRKFKEVGYEDLKNELETLRKDLEESSLPLEVKLAEIAGLETQLQELESAEVDENLIGTGKTKAQVRKEVKMRKITLDTLREDLEIAKRDRDAHLEKYETLKGRVAITNQELTDMLASLDLLEREKVTLDELEQFTSIVSSAANMFKDDQDVLDFEGTMVGSEGSIDLMTRYVNARRFLDESIAATVDSLNTSQSEVQQRLDILEAQIKAAQDLLDDIEKLKVSDPELAAEIEAMYGQEVAGYLTKSVERKDKLLSDIQGYTRELEAVESLKKESLQKIYRDYIHIRMVQAFQKIVAFDAQNLLQIEPSDALEMDVEEIAEDVLDEKVSDPQIRPDLMKVGFSKSTGMGHPHILKAIAEKYPGIKDLNELNKLAVNDPELDNLLDQATWLHWVQSAGDRREKGTTGPLDDFTRLVAFHRDNVPDALKDLFPPEKFYSTDGGKTSQQVMFVAVTARIAKGGSVESLTPIMHNGRYVHSKMMDPKDATEKDSIADQVRSTFSKTMDHEDAGLEKINENFRAVKNGVLQSQMPLVLRIKGKSSGVARAKSETDPKDAVRTSKGGLSTVPLIVAVPKAENKGEKFVTIELAGASKTLPKNSKVGYVYAYDAQSGQYIPMQRMTISEGDQIQVSRMLHLMLDRFSALKAEGKSTREARKALKDFQLEHSSGNMPLIDQISDLVQMRLEEGGSKFQLTTKLKDDMLHVVYGKDSTMVSLEDFQKKSEAYQGLMDFLATKRYHVRHRRAATATEPVKVNGRMTGKFQVGKDATWVRFTLGEDLKVQSARKYTNYNEFLLTSENGRSPVVAMTPAYKASSVLFPNNFGAYVTFNSKELTDPKSRTAVPRDVDMTGTVAPVSQEESAEADAFEAAEVENTIPDGPDILKGAEVSMGEDPSDADMASALDLEDGDYVGISADGTIIEGKEEEAVTAESTATDMQVLIDKSESSATSESIAAPVFTSEAKVTIQELEGEMMLAIREGRLRKSIEVPQSVTSWNDLAELLPDITDPVLQKKILEQIENNAAPFMRSTAPDVLNVLSENIDEEIARVNGMTRLEVAMTEGLLGTLDDPAVAQLTSFGKVLLSSLAPSGALYHEGFHNVSLYLLSKNDRRRLYSKVRNLPGTTKDYLGNEVNFREMNDLQAEEWLAEEFRRWILSGMTRKVGREDVRDDRNLIQKFFDSLRLVLRRLFRLNNGFEYDQNMDSITDMFRSMESGRFLKSLPTAERSSGTDMYMRVRPEGMTKEMALMARRIFLAEIAQRLDVTMDTSAGPLTLGISDMYRYFTGDDSSQVQEFKVKVMGRSLLDQNGVQAILKERLAAYPEGSKERIAIESLTSLFGTDSKTAKADFIKKLLEEYVIELGMVEKTSRVVDKDEDRTNTKEEGDDVSNDENWDKRLGEESVFTASSKHFRLLMGTLVNPKRNHLGLMTLYPINDVARDLQPVLLNAVTYEEVLDRVRNLALNNRYPWADQLLGRLLTLEDKIKEGDIHALLFRQNLSADMRKVANSPALPMVSPDGRVSVMDPAEMATLENIKREWDVNLKTLYAQGADHLTMSGNTLMFKKDGTVKLPGMKPMTMEAFIKHAGKAGTAELMDIAELFGVEFSDRENMLDSENESFRGETVRIALRNAIDSLVINNLKQGSVASIFDRLYSGQLGRANALVDLEMVYGRRQISTSYVTATGKRRHSIQDPTFISQIGIKSWDQRWDLRETSYAENSLLAQKLKELGRLDLKVHEMMGLRLEDSREDGDTMSKLNSSDLLVAHANALLDGITVMARASDKSTELGVSLDIWDNVTDHLKVFRGYIEDEMVQSVRYSYMAQHIDFKKAEPYKLRLMAGMLNPGIIKILHDHIDANLNRENMNRPWTPELEGSIRAGVKEVIAENQPLINRVLEESLKKETLKLDTAFRKFRLVESAIGIYADDPSVQKDSVGVVVNGLHINAFKDHILDSEKRVVRKSEYERALREMVIRHTIGKNEMFKFYIGDTALLPAMFKRLGGASGPKIMMDTSPIVLEQALITSDLPTRTVESGTVFGKMIEFQELKGKISDEMYQEFRNILSKEISDAYLKETDKADGTIWATSHFMRYVAMGTKPWDIHTENAYQGMREGTVPDAASVAENAVGFAPQKWQYFGPSRKGGLMVPGMLKMSVVTLDRTLGQKSGKQYPNYLAMVDFLEKNGYDGIVLPSADKLIKVKDELMGTWSPDVDGRWSMNVETELPLMEIDLSYLGLQQQISQEFKGKVLNTVQAQSHLSSDMYENGEIIPEMEDYVDLLEEFNDLRSELVQRGFNEMLEEFFITRTEDGYMMSRESYESVIKFLIDEGYKRDVGQMLLAGLETASPDNFRMEMLVDPVRMETVLFSALSKRTVKQKRKGEMLIQVSEAGYEVAEVTDAEGNVSLVNSELGFYRNPEGDGWVMEIYAPNFMKGLMGQELNVREDGIYSNGVLVAEKEALDAIGIRIPTDGIHSIEVIRIKDFLPPHAGPAVVVPHLLLIKSGSDFDIDKLTMYFKNLRKDGSTAKYFTGLNEWYDEQVRLSESNLWTEEELEELAEKKGLRAKKEMYEALSENMQEMLFNEKYREFHTNEGVKLFEEWLLENPEATVLNVQSKQALENRTISIMTELLSAPERANEFMRPVNTDTLEGISELILREAKDVLGLVDITDMSDLHNSTTLLGNLAVARAAWEGKATVGAYALTATHHVKSQKAGLSIDLNQEIDTVSGKALLQLNFEGMESEGTLSLSKVVNAAGQRISDVISQLVNAAVDNANKPLLQTLNFGLDMASAVSFLVRAGVPVQTVALFMNQPIVREYMESVTINRSMFLDAHGKKMGMTKLIDGLRSSYSITTEESTGGVKFNDTELMRMMKLSPDSLTPKDMALQRQILDDLLVYMGVGNDLTTAVTAQSFDTKPPRSRASALVIMQKYTQVLQKGVFNNLENVVGGSYLGSMQSVVEESSEMFKELFITETSRTHNIARQMLLQHLMDPTSKALRLSTDKTVRSLEKMTSSFWTALIQRVPDSASTMVKNEKQRLLFGTGANDVTIGEKILEGDIFTMKGIPVITTNLGGVHGAGLAKSAAEKGLVKRGDGAFKASEKVVQLPVKKVWSDSMAMNNNMELLKSSLRSLIKTAKSNPSKTYLLPLAGLGHGEGSVTEIMPLLIKTVKASENIKLVLPKEGMSLGRPGTVRKDTSLNKLPEITTMLRNEGLLEKNTIASQTEPSLAQTIAKIQRGLLKPELKDNLWISKLIPRVQPIRNGVENDSLEFMVKGIDPIEMAVLDESFREIVSIDPVLAKDILMTAVLQSGTVSSPYQLLGVIPGDYYQNWVQGIVDNFQINGDMGYPSTFGYEDAELFLADFFANNTGDRNLMPKMFNQEDYKLAGAFSSDQRAGYTIDVEKSAYGPTVIKRRLFVSDSNNSVSEIDINSTQSRSFQNYTENVRPLKVIKKSSGDLKSITKNCK